MSETNLIVPISTVSSFNVYKHMKTNILNQSNNCKDENDESYYCIKCMKSTCDKCDLDEHKNDRLIPKSKIYELDDTFLQDLISDTSKVEDLAILKMQTFEALDNTFNQIKNKLDDIYHSKKKEIEKIYNLTTENISKTNKVFNEIKFLILNFYQKNENFFQIQIKKNLDEQNTVFLMKLDILDSLEKQNIITMNSLKNLKNKLQNYKDNFSKISQNIIKCYESNFPKYSDDFINSNTTSDRYHEIRNKIQLYNDNINNFKEKISNGYNRTGNFKDLEEIVKKLDSKNKKGFDSINLNKDIENENNYGEKSSNNSSMKNIHRIYKESPRSLINRSNYSNFNSSSLLKSNCSTKRFHRSRSSCSIESKKPIDITLELYFVQKFFSYFITDLYNQYDSKKCPKKSFDINSRIFNKYQERFYNLKERAKPIIGTSEISLFNQITNKIEKIPVKLIKNKHGYSIFPEGSRHIIVKDTLFIIGGVNESGNPINVCLTFNIFSKEIQRIKDSNFPHSYHSIEYIDNFDCIAIIGGEMNSTCEILNSCDLTWTALPDLNIARSNVSLYFNEKTNELYAMFGMIGTILEPLKYCNTIETLNICNPKSGWNVINYYRNSMINLSYSYVTAFPFTLNKLIIRGSRNERMHKLAYCIYDMDKKEMSFASDNTVREIEENEFRIKAFSNNLNKTKLI